MHPQIKSALQAQRFFKLICGASYRNEAFIATLAQLFAEAGAHVIDVGARPELVAAARAGIEAANVPVAGLPLIMVSVGINQDLHFLRVEKDFSRCDSRGLCVNACPHEVFVGSEIRLENCLGCDHCVIACPSQALTLVARDPLADISTRLAECLAAGATALEVHTGDGGRAELEALLHQLQPWRTRLDLLAFSLGAHGQSPAELAELAALIRTLAGPDILIQADGKPISGRKGEKSTLACLELAEFLIASGLEGFIQVSGGTNNLTGALAQRRGSGIHGVGMGSFARKYLDLSPSETLTPEGFAEKLSRARDLVHSVVAAPAPQGVY
jgi:NAD-dependent dihydropyrimidine dehydrogenase PreA subunit